MTAYEEICLNYFGDKISLESAIAKIQALPDSWQLNAVAEKQSIVLKHHCEICETTENLQLKHTRHPTDKDQLKDQFTHQLLAKAMKGFKIDLAEFNTYKDQHLHIVNGCNKCLMAAVNAHCPACKKSIDSDAVVHYYSIPGLENIAKSAGVRGKDLKTLHDLFVAYKQSQIKTELADQFKTEIDDYAFRQSYIETIRYLSLIDTITICGDCTEEPEQQAPLLTQNKNN